MEFRASDQSRQIYTGARFTVSRVRREGEAAVIVKQAAPGAPEPQTSEQLRHEYALLRTLELPGVARALGLWTIDGKPAVIFEDAGPVNLAEALEARPLALDGFFALALPMAQAVAALHDCNVVHHDLGPANFVLGSGSPPVTLVDFDDATADDPTHAGRAADLRALGATFYAMLTGEVLREQGPPAVNPAVPAALWQLVGRLLATDPRARYQTAGALVADLTQLHLLEDGRLRRELAAAERSRDEQALYLRTVFRGHPGATWATDRDLRFTHAAGRSLALIGLEPNGLVGKSVYEFLGATDEGDPAIAHHLAALAGASQSFSYPLSGRWFDVLIEPLIGEGGQVAGCVGAAFDTTSKRESDARLARSEAQLEEAQRVAHIGSYEWDIKANVVSWSDELKRIYGVEEGGFRGTFEDFLARVVPSDVAATRAIILAAYRSLGPFAYDHRIVRGEGQTRMLHTQGEVIKDAAGKPARMVGTCWDITELSEATAAQQRALSLLRATIEATADGILVVDRERKVVAHNQRFLSLWQIPAELAARGEDERLLNWILEQVEDPDQFLRSVGERYAHPESESIDLVRFKDGRVFERYTGPQRVDDEVVGRVWSFRDISERLRLLKRTEFLAEATRLLVSLDVEQALEAVANLAVPSLGSGCAIDLFGGGAPRRLVAAGQDPGWMRSVEVHPTVLEGHPVIYEVGSVSCVGAPLMVKDRLVGALTLAALRHQSYSAADLDLAQDLGRRAALALENARLYRRAREALSARDEFLSIAAHEIRGPISAIHLAVQTIRNGIVEPGALLELIERQDRRLSRFVDELLDLGRFREGQLWLEYQTVDLAQLVRDVACRMEPERARSGSSISVTAPGQVIGSWDRFRLDQVVTNLISNALKFGGGKPIELSVGSDGGVASLSVRDHGIGIAPQLQKRIFDPFQRGVSMRHYGGLGLGLHIVKTIVEALGGEVTAQGEPGLGSTFTVELPQARAGEEDAHIDDR